MQEIKETKTDIEIIKKACVEANPEIGGTCSTCGKQNPFASEPCDPPDLPHCSVKPRPIHLADVLLAIGNLLVIVDCGGNFYRMSMKLSDKLPKLDPKNGTAKWNLRKTLEDQDPATITFIASLLKN